MHVTVSSGRSGGQNAIHSLEEMTGVDFSTDMTVLSTTDRLKPNIPSGRKRRSESRCKPAISGRLFRLRIVTVTDLVGGGRRLNNSSQVWIEIPGDFSFEPRWIRQPSNLEWLNVGRDQKGAPANERVP